jgi:hypothetical protein
MLKATPANPPFQDRLQRFIGRILPARALRRSLSSSLQSCRRAAIKRNETTNHASSLDLPILAVKSQIEGRRNSFLSVIANHSQLQEGSRKMLWNGIVW